MNKEEEKIIDELYILEKSDKNASHDHIDREALIRFIKNLKIGLFLNYFCSDFTKDHLDTILLESFGDIKEALRGAVDKYQDKLAEFFASLPSIKKDLTLDLEAMYNGDPAANGYEEIVTTYPGFTAIYCYRIAHKFYSMGLKHVARLISEYAHSRTGIDINAGATIGKSFFIDHGTGIVIGETTIIGDNCKLYQGVTLGALSLKKGRELINKKRHPTLLNNVVIYSGSSIFGGETVIGNNVTIGANVEIKESVPDNTVVRGNR